MTKDKHQVNIRLSELHMIMLWQLREQHKMKITDILRKSIEFYFNYLNEKK